MPAAIRYKRSGNVATYESSTHTVRRTQIVLIRIQRIIIPILRWQRLVRFFDNRRNRCSTQSKIQTYK